MERQNREEIFASYIVNKSLEYIKILSKLDSKKIKIQLERGQKT